MESNTNMETTKHNKRWLIGGIVYAILLFVVLTVSNLETINIWFGKVWLVLRPVAFGLILAYILNPFFRFYERKVFCRLKLPMLRRGISLTLSYLTLLLIIVCLFWLILPKLIDAIFLLVDHYEDYAAATADYINDILTPINRFMQKLTQKETSFHPIDGQNVIDFISGLLPKADASEDGLFNSENINQITSIFSSIFGFLADWLLAFFISLYFLATKEKRHAQIMRLRNAVFSDKVNGRISRAVSTLDHSLGGFIKGKFIEMIILWIISYALFSILSIQYAILFSTFIAVMNIIPLIGSVIAAIPIGFVILLAENSKFIPFLLVMILIIQLDSNIIAPKILGDNTGVSALCVVIALATMGSLWGFAGMVLGVPLFATILKLGDHYTEKRLQKKGLPSEIESYYSPDAVVDPAKDSHKSTDKMVKRLEKKVLRIKEDLLTTKRASLPASDRFWLRFYEIMVKYKLLVPSDDETIVQFYAEQQQNRIRMESDARYASYKNTASSANDPQA